MAQWMSVLILFVGLSVQAAYQCDLGKELASVKEDRLTGRDSRPFFHAHNVRQEQHMSAKKAYEAVHKTPENAYLETPEGKKTLFKLKDLREGFDFDSAVAYLMGEPLRDSPSNDSPVDFTHTYKKGNKTFFLDEGRVVAVKIQAAKDVALLKVLNSDCSTKEIVNFETLEYPGWPYRYRINAAYCDQVGTGKLAAMDSDKQDAMKVFLPDDEDELNKMKSQIVRDCKLVANAKAAAPSKSGGSKSSGKAGSTK